MTRFDRYIFRNLTVGISAALFFLLVLANLIHISELLSRGVIGSGHFGWKTLAYVTLYDLPQNIATFLPSSVLLGTLLTLGQMAQHNELTILLASGVSRLRIARSALIWAVLAGCCSMAIQEWWAPPWNTESAQMTDLALGRSAPANRGDGLWIRDFKTYVRMEHVGENHIQGLTLIQKEQAGMRLLWVERADWNGQKWGLHGAHGLLFTPQGIKHRDETGLDLHVTPTGLRHLLSQTLFPSLSERWARIRAERDTGLNAARDALALWQAALAPLSILAMTLLALPFAFAKGRDDHLGRKLVFGILGGVAFYLLQNILGNLSLLLYWPPVLGAMLPALCFALPGLWILARK